ncbi:MAG: hypothetical protein K6F08_00770 [bacterium]|nr:hypothetical protein [bacterium]
MVITNLGNAKNYLSVKNYLKELRDIRDRVASDPSYYAGYFYNGRLPDVSSVSDLNRCLARGREGKLAEYESLYNLSTSIKNSNKVYDQLPTYNDVDEAYYAFDRNFNKIANSQNAKAKRIPKGVEIDVEMLEKAQAEKESKYKDYTKKLAAKKQAGRKLAGRRGLLALALLFFGAGVAGGVGLLWLGLSVLATGALGTSVAALIGSVAGGIGVLVFSGRVLWSKLVLGAASKVGEAKGAYIHSKEELKAAKEGWLETYRNFELLRRYVASITKGYSYEPGFNAMGAADAYNRLKEGKPVSSESYVVDGSKVQEPEKVESAPIEKQQAPAPVVAQNSQDEQVLEMTKSAEETPANDQKIEENNGEQQGQPAIIPAFSSEEFASDQPKKEKEVKAEREEVKKESNESQEETKEDDFVSGNVVPEDKLNEEEKDALTFAKEVAQKNNNETKQEGKAEEKAEEIEEIVNSGKVASKKDLSEEDKDVLSFAKEVAEKRNERESKVAEKEVKEVKVEQEEVSEPSQKTSARISDEEVEHIAKSSLFSRIVAKVKNIKDNIKEKVLSDDEEETISEENVEEKPTKPVEHVADKVDEDKVNNLARSGLLSRILAKKNQIKEKIVEDEEEVTEEQPVKEEAETTSTRKTSFSLSDLKNQPKQEVEEAEYEEVEDEPEVEQKETHLVPYVEPIKLRDATRKAQEENDAKREEAINELMRESENLSDEEVVERMGRTLEDDYKGDFKEVPAIDFIRFEEDLKENIASLKENGEEVPKELEYHKALCDYYGRFVADEYNDQGEEVRTKKAKDPTILYNKDANIGYEDLKDKKTALGYKRKALSKLIDYAGEQVAESDDEDSIENFKDFAEHYAIEADKLKVRQKELDDEIKTRKLWILNSVVESIDLFTYGRELATGVNETVNKKTKVVSFNERERKIADEACKEFLEDNLKELAKKKYTTRQNAQARAELEAKIDELQESRSKLDAYIIYKKNNYKTNEDLNFQLIVGDANSQTLEVLEDMFKRTGKNTVKSKTIANQRTRVEDYEQFISMPKENRNKEISGVVADDINEQIKEVRDYIVTKYSGVIDAINHASVTDERFMFARDNVKSVEMKEAIEYIDDLANNEFTAREATKATETFDEFRRVAADVNVVLDKSINGVNAKRSVQEIEENESEPEEYEEPEILPKDREYRASRLLQPGRKEYPLLRAGEGEDESGSGQDEGPTR